MNMFDYEYWGTGVFPAHVNMAIEEALAARVAQQRTKAAIRFYGFPHDAIVLGYAQATDIIKNLHGAELTRRITGGSHVQTGPNTIAYSFVVPRDGTFRTFEDMRAYYAERVASALEALGIDNVTVDNKASTIMVNDRIIASHAIWWGIERALMHGLLMMTPYDVNRVAARVAFQQRKIGNTYYSEYDALKNLATVGQETASARNDTLRALVSNAILAEVTKNMFERHAIDTLPEAKRQYSASTWVSDHRPTFTPAEAEAIPGEELDGPLKKNLGYCLFLQVPDKDFKAMIGLQEQR